MPAGSEQTHPSWWHSHAKLLSFFVGTASALAQPPSCCLEPCFAGRRASAAGPCFHSASALLQWARRHETLRCLRAGLSATKARSGLLLQGPTDEERARMTSAKLQKRLERNATEVLGCQVPETRQSS